MFHFPGVTLSFSSLISAYSKLQSGVVNQIKSLAKNISSATPGKFILLQFQMAQLTQVGESISNVIAQVNTMIGYVVQNSK
jgi:hypothetical protein